MHRRPAQRTNQNLRHARAGLRAVLAAGFVAILPGCGTLSLAGVIMSAIAGGDGSDIISNPMMDRPPGESVSDALSQTPQTADPACLSVLKELRAEEERGVGDLNADQMGAEPRSVAARMHMDGPVCAIEWTCLPGFPEPARMLVCRGGDAGTVKAPLDASLNPEGR